jgi:hypothetical protein
MFRRHPRSRSGSHLGLVRSAWFRVVRDRLLYHRLHLDQLCEIRSDTLLERASRLLAPTNVLLEARPGRMEQKMVSVAVTLTNATAETRASVG